MKKSNFGKISTFIAGIIIFILGLFAMTIPGRVVTTLAFVAGIAILLQGITGIYSFMKIKDSISYSGLLLFGALIDLVFAFFILSNILATAVAMTMLVGFWYLFSSLLRIVRAFELKKFGLDKWWLVLLTGILSTIFSFFIIWHPVAGGLLITYSVAFSIMGCAVMIIAESFSSN